jgi:putative nucleotidyltransferase with HDIG domain
MVARTMNKDLKFKRVYIYVEDKQKSQFFLSATAGVPKKLVAKFKDQPLKFKQKGLVMKSIMEKDVIDIRGKNISSQFRKFFDQPNGLIIPLTGRTIVVGIMIVEYDSERNFVESDYDFYLTVGDQIESSIVKKRALEEVKNFSRKLKKKIDAATEKLRKYSESLEKQIEDNKELRERESRIHFEIISALVTSIESKDTYTRGHSVRVASYACRLGRELELSNEQIIDLRYAGLLHDIGKVAIDQIVLNKNTALTEAEAKALTRHPVVGAKIANSVRFLRSAAKIIRSHHERWDGKGYPDKLKGLKIPIEARILAIADAYDAMITRRSYGKEMTKAEAIKELEAGSGKQFDPKVVKAFVKIIKRSRQAPKSRI